MLSSFGGPLDHACPVSTNSSIVNQVGLTLIPIGPIIPDPVARHSWYVGRVPLLQIAIQVEGSELLGPVDPVFVNCSDIPWRWSYLLCSLCALRDCLIAVPDWDRVTIIPGGCIDVVAERFSIGQVLYIGLLLVVLVEEYTCGQQVSPIYRTCRGLESLTMACSRYSAKGRLCPDTCMQYVIERRGNFCTADSLTAPRLSILYSWNFEIEKAEMVSVDVLGLKLMVVWSALV